MIEIDNLYKSFGPKVVLDGVSLNIPEGDSTCIIGKSGSGKSVLLKHIVGLLEPDSGTVKVDTKQIDKLDRKELFALRRQMGFVFQGAALFDSLNVFENTVLGMYEHGNRNLAELEKEAIRVISAVQLLPDIEEVGEVQFIKEWEILKNKKPSDLSGGMRKRVGVARALVGNPKYIFYDEPTTGLDPVTSEQIDDLIAELSNKLNVTSVIITHDMFSVFRIAKTVAMIHDGKLRYNGDVEGIKNSKDEVVAEFIERFVRG
ncbi:MAG: ATP-binding cassette domain-containing protein [Candidatus Kapabacteria bacterium]|nr:ATP-binding cassette domain-containing protein [Ignavibacteriota bacterium]MCW5883505.1 ATP-binding cassette domain-containing protein [Candidatus Kapabacteria bacterium]